MFYIKDPCPICGSQEAIGFVMGSDGKTMVLVCDECDAVWLDPRSVLASSAIFPSWQEGYRIEQIGCSTAFYAGARWATKEEIDAAGLIDFVAGEGASLHN